MQEQQEAQSARRKEWSAQRKEVPVQRDKISAQREEVPAPGTFYRHFKNKLYQILAVAVHSETEEQMVVYQALYGDYKIYVRPLDMFMSPVDREKYPDADQTFRFERVMMGGGLGTEPESRGIGSRENGSGGTGNRGAEGGKPDPEETEFREPEPMNPQWVGRFLDADTPEQQLAVLRQCSGHITQRELDCICLALDLPSEGGQKDMESQLDSLRQAIRLKQRYCGSRLRTMPKPEE